ncbi:MAG: cobalamin-dependent protein [Desulfurococcales archaeon]|nr:cobalamin-dependent protein [Desulfurococcales archaeon]
MRILLSLPPDVHRLEIYRITGVRAPPLGLASIAAVLEEEGHEVRIIDSPTLGLSIDGWISEVRSWSPDIIGISMLTPLAPKAYNAIKMIRDYLPDVPIVVGGPHPTFMYEEALNEGADIVVLGEGEYTMLELANTIDKYGFDHERLKSVKGIAFRNREGRVVVTPPRPVIMNLDSLPWPARHLLPMDRYTLFNKSIRVAHVMASRGCPYGCTYCTTSYFWRRMLRFRSPENVVGEIEYLADRYNVKYVLFADDELVISRKFVKGFIEEMKSRGLDIPFACGARVDHLTRDYMKMLVDNNCTTIYVGVESASQYTLNKIGKRITLDQVRRVFEWRREVGGHLVASFIIGFPWETIEDMKNTVDFAVELDPDYAQFTILTPYPGTPMFNYAKEHGLIEDWNWEHYTTMRPVMRGFKFTREDLKRVLKYAYRKFYLRTSFIFRELKSGRIRDLLGILGRELVRYLSDVVVHPIQWRDKEVTRA